MINRQLIVGEHIRTVDTAKVVAAEDRRASVFSNT